MEWAIVLTLIVLGLILAVIEVIVIPGTTVVGILGLATWMVGIWFGYAYLGSNIGTWLLTSSLAMGIGIALYGLRSGAWKRVALTQAHNNKVNEPMTQAIKQLTVGMQGSTRSALRPIGQVLINGMLYEAHSQGEYIEANTAIEILAIQDNLITVQTI